ncbi:MAG: 50S ribosomal protein L28 [Lentisphaerae bacterium]|nr:50S ribosomal protein L28 [Lentisphaerota bacterium]MCP4102909.1 50S ribosomal protein L28 [Lentisphaerota bacterium]
MSNVCHLCGKRKVAGGSITRKGLAKAQGGIGMHVVKNNKRTFKPNIQSVKIVEGGTTKKVKMCASCIRSGKFSKA